MIGLPESRAYAWRPLAAWGIKTVVGVIGGMIMSIGSSFRSFSALGLVVLVAQAASGQTSADQYSYDAKGRLTQVQRGSGVLSKYALDKADNRSQLQVALQFSTNWLATSSSIYHAVGFAEPWGGWAANVSNPVGALTYGPYTTSVPVGNRAAAWRLMIDAPSGPASDVVVNIEVYDTTAAQVLATRSILRKEFVFPMAYQTFELPFVMSTARAGHQLEFRTYYAKTAYVNVQKIGYY